MKQSLSMRQGMGLTMTPALQQAIRLLQLSSVDLELEIQELLDSNLMLETEEPGAEAVADLPGSEPEQGASEDKDLLAELPQNENLPEEMPVDVEWNDVFDEHVPSKSSSSDDESLHDFLQANMRSAVSLAEHLLEQARALTLEEAESLALAYLINYINEDGYLEDFEEILESIESDYAVPVSTVEAMLMQLQAFDPPGVGARNLQECLAIQIKQLPRSRVGRWAALEMVEENLLQVARKDLQGVMQATDLTREDVEAGMALIASLQPHPGRPFQAHESDYLMPDVIVTRDKGRWRVALNPEHTPKLRVNSRYQRFIKRADQSPEQLKLKEHLQEARYFINSLESRNETILRVSQCIVEEQRAFLEYGEEAMRPLVLRDVAQSLGIHESTVSRATANKYMLTPRGLFELKYFFSSHVSTTQGGVASATAIQAMIKRLITAEDPAKPLSDSILAKLLLEEGVKVARRTVAKYREAMNISPSHERKAVA